ncbi:MAG: hypothetical protein ACFE8U_02365 [Candidatus Hermodarchaeota archaeon]
MRSYREYKTILKKMFRNSHEQKTIEKKTLEPLQGKALQIYWYLLTHEPHGIREIQKALKIPSPSSVSFQINKLVENGIVSKTENDKYFIKEEIKSGILSFYIRFGYRIIPRFSVYLCVYIAGLLGFFLVLLRGGDQYLFNPTNFVFLLYLIFGTGVFVYESIRIWKMKPN